MLIVTSRTGVVKRNPTGIGEREAIIGMNAKEYLGRARQARLRAEALAERRAQCEALADQRTGGPGPEMQRLQRRLDRDIDAFAALSLEIEGRIDALESPIQRDVLRYRYLNGWSWKEIAARTRYCPSWLWKKHEAALKALEAQIGE